MNKLLSYFRATSWGCLLPPGGVWKNVAGYRHVVCFVYCRSMLYHSVFVLGGGGGFPA